jgi:Amidohydrolase family
MKCCIRRVVMVLPVFCFLWAGGILAEEGVPTVFIHANLVPMTSEIILPDHALVVEGGHISFVGPSGRATIPQNARVIDCDQAFLMPGLADMHMHTRSNWMSDTWPVSPLKLYLANGVTTIRCFGPGRKSGLYALKWRDRIEKGLLDGPRILTCGPNLRGYLKNPDHMVIKQKYQGFDFIKPYSYLTREEYHSILSTAKKLNIYVAGHIPFQVGLDGVLAEGMDEIAHIEELLWEFSGMDRNKYFPNENDWMTYAIQTTFSRFESYFDLSLQDREQMLADLIRPTIAKLKGKQIPFCTTLVVDDVIVQKLFEPDRFIEKSENQYLPKWYLDRFKKGKEKHQRQFKGGENFAHFKYGLDKKLLLALRKNKNPLLLSTDAGTGGLGVVPGFSLHDELDILIENGLTPYEAIAAGTIVASKVVEQMNGEDNFGTLARGKRADLILLKQNPLEDVTHIRNIMGVMAAGRWYDHKALAALIAP